MTAEGLRREGHSQGAGMPERADRSVALAANTSWNLLNFRGALIDAFIARGWRVGALAPPDQHTDRLRSQVTRFTPLEWHNAGIKPTAELRSLVRIHRWLRTERPGIVFTFTPKINIYTGLVARLLKVRHVPNVSGLGRSFMGGSFTRIGTLFMYRCAFRRCAAVVFQNRTDQELFVRLGLVREAQAVLVPGSGIDLVKFAPDPQESARSGPFTFLMVARLLCGKGVREFSEAAEQVTKSHPTARFRIAGRLDLSHPDSIPEALVGRWKQLGLVEYAGEVDDIRLCYRQADCVVLPSYREGMPRSVLEASAMALPVIVSNAPGCIDAVLPGESGLVCNVKDTQDLARSMLKMLDLSEDERARMGNAGRRLMEQQFDERRVVERYLDFLTGAPAVGRSS